MSYEITGNIIVINETQQFPSGFSKREFVVKTADKFPQEVKLEFVKDRCSQLDQYQPGDPVRVSFNLRGNEHNGKYYVNLVAWRIETDAEGAFAGPAPSTPDNAYERPPF